MTDRYAYWNAALEGVFAPITEGDPCCGFYRIKSAGDFHLPVAIWSERDLIWVQLGKGEANAQADVVRETWMRCAKHPVTEEAYRHALATGQWPGEAPAERPAGEGHNRPPEGPTELLDAVDGEVDAAAAWVAERKVVSQADADKCETLANRLLDWKKHAKAAHEAEKKPHLDAGRAVDKRWNPRITRLETTVRLLKNAATAFLVAREEEKRAAAAQHIARGDPAPARMEARATTSGASGRKLALRTHKFAEIGDWDAAIAFFRDHPDVRELVQRLADKCAQVGAPVPGVTFKQEQRAA